MSEMVGMKIANTIAELGPNQSATIEMYLPQSEDVHEGQYSVRIEDKNNQIFVKVASQKWPLVARQPLYLNASEVLHNNRVSYPTKMCLYISRGTKYSINITC